MLEDDASAHKIVNNCLAFEWCAKANHGRTTRRFVVTNLVARQVAVLSRRRCWVVCLARVCASRLELLRSLETAVGEALCEELINGSLVVLTTPALQIRPVPTTQTRRLVEGESEPVEGALNLLDRTGFFPLGIRIFDAQYGGATVVAGEQPVVERCPYTTNMQKAGRRGGEADAYRHSRTVPRRLTVMSQTLVGASGPPPMLPR